MKAFQFILIAIISLIFLTSCLPGKVKSIQSLSEADIGLMNVENIYVRLNPSFAGLLRRSLEQSKNDLILNQNDLDKINARRVVGHATRSDAKEKVSRDQRHIEFIQKEIKNISLDIKTTMLDLVEENNNAIKYIDLLVEVNSFKLTNAGEVIMIGGVDSMHGTVTVLDRGTTNQIGIYNITVIDTNASGGVMGVAVRGSDPRGDMIKEFSKSTLSILSRKSTGKKTKTD